MVGLQHIYLFLAFITLFSSTATLAYAQGQTVTAVLACPLKDVLKESLSCTPVTEELEVHVEKLTALLLQGHKTALVHYLHEVTCSQKQTLTQKQHALIREAFARSLKNFTSRSHEHLSLTDFFTAAMEEPLQKNVLSYAKRPLTAETLMNLMKSCTKVTSAEEGVKTLISQHIPYGSLFRNIAGAWATARNEITQKDQETLYDDKLILSSPLLAIAHTLALEKALALLYILFAPSSHPCERIKALYLINHIHLLGSSENIYRSFIAQLNYSYFSPRGNLLDYDPTRFSSTQPRPMMHFVTFLKKLCLSKDHFLHALREGGRHGLQILQEQYFIAVEKEWKQKKESRLIRYSREIIKGMLGHDLSFRKVDPLVICRAEATKGFIHLISLCEEAQSYQDREKNILNLIEARSLIAHYKNANPAHAYPTVQYMQQYYEDTLRKIPLEMLNHLNHSTTHSVNELLDPKEKQLPALATAQ